MDKLKVLAVFGTRPEAIKMAPLVLELQRRAEFDCRVCVTAQHREMLDSVMDCFHLTADYDLDIMEPGQSLSGITTRALNGLEQVYLTCAPQLVLVHGDTTTTFSGALAAYYAKIPVGHVEAGLRTGDRYNPFPEEMNRALVGRLAELHFAPTAQNAENLRAEGITDGIFVTGNTVIDAMAYTVGDGRFSSPLLQELAQSGRRLITMTCHRRENYGRPMAAIFAAVAALAAEFPDVEIIYPVHLSPTVRAAAQVLAGIPNIHCIEPLDPIEMHRLLARSTLVLTDSGGLQEEAPALGKPVLVLRRETERPEAIAAGTARLAGVETEEILSLARTLLTDAAAYRQMSQAVNPYGDGQASRRIAEAILYHFGFTQAPPEVFRP